MKIKKALKYILPFGISIILMLIIFGLLGIYPFGTKDLLWFDTQAQYIDFLSYWQDVIKGQASIFYSFGKNLGGNMFGLYTYYLTSPINLIIILFKKIDLPLAFMIIILIKMGLCASTFRYYLEHSKFIINNSNNHNKIKKIIFSVTYSLISFNIVYCMSHMWLDCILLLPLIFLGIEKIVEEKKCWLYIISFTMAIIGNYYIAFMIALFSIPYFIYMLLWNNQNKKIKEIIKEDKEIIWLYVRSSLISVFIGGIIIIPTLYSLVESKGKLYSPSGLTLYMYFDYFTLFAKNVLGSFSMQELRLGAPNIYSGIFTLLLLVLYFINNKISKKEKIYSGIFLFLFFICFYFNPVNIFLHMLQGPMSFPFRYSFIFSFLILVYAYKCIQNIDGIEKKYIVMTSLSLILLFMIVDKNGYEYLVNWKVFITIIYVVIYTVFILNIEKIKKVTYIILAVIVGIELVLNGYLVQSWMPYGDRNNYREHIQKYTQVYEYIKGIDKGLYRISYSNRKSLDDALMYDFAGLEHYSSVGEKATEQFMNLLGYEGSPLVEYSTGTILDNSILGVKYILHTSPTDFYMSERTINDILIYNNPYALPFAYVSSNDVYEYNSKYTFSSPFEYQNYIFGLITGKEQKYYEEVQYEFGESSNITVNDYTNSYVLSLTDGVNIGYVDLKIEGINQPIYMYLKPATRERVKVSINGVEKQTQDANISYIGCSEDEITIRITIYNEIELNKNLLQYLDTEKTIPELLKLNERKIEVISFSDTNIKSEIEAKKGETLFTTIPYEKGWKVYINNKEVEYSKTLDTFISVKLEEGKNIIEFKYKSPGITKGLIITIFGFILLGLEIIVRRLSTEKIKIENKQEIDSNNSKDENIEVEKNSVDKKVTTKRGKNTSKKNKKK